MEIITKKVKRPYNVMFMGEPGVGKSTWAAFADKPFFIGPEEHGELEVARPKKRPDSYDEVISQLDWLLKNPSGYKTLVLDTIDGVEFLLHQKILSGDKAETMNKAKGGYGNGHEAAMNEMCEIRDRMSALRDKYDYNLITLCHTKSVKIDNTILGQTFQSLQTSLHHKTQKIFIDWVSAVLCATYVEYAKTDAEKFAVGEGERVIYTQKRPGHLAKNRYGLPYQLSMPEENPFKPFFDAYNAYYGKGETADEVRSEIESLAQGLPDEETIKKVKVTVEKADGDMVMLKKIRNQVHERLHGKA